MADHSPKELRLTVVSLTGDVKDDAALLGETVGQFIQRLSVGKDDMSNECVLLVHGDRILPLDQRLHDCGLSIDATVTLLRQMQSRLCLTAAFYGDDSGKCQPLWVDEGSPGAKFCQQAAAWCCKFKEYATEGAFGAVCFLEHPGQIQHLVDNGDLSKTEAVRGILACFIRSLLALGRIGTHAGRDGAGEPCDNEMASSILREKLPRIACGVDVLRDWSNATEKYVDLSQTYLEYVRETDPVNLGSWRTHVASGRLQGCKLCACEEIPMNLFNDDDTELIGWKELLDRHHRSSECFSTSQTCNERCEEEWVGFLRYLDRPDNVWFQIEHNMGDSSDFDGFAGGMYKFAGGVYIGDEVVAPSQLPSYYIFQWAMADF